MKRKEKKLTAEFAPETRFAVVIAPPAPFRAVVETELERLKDRLLRESLATVTVPELYSALRRASNEAAALAWTTPVPLLLLPELFREKAESARTYIARQAALLQRGRPARSRLTQAA